MRSLSFAISQGEYDALIALLNSAPDWDIARSLLPKLTGAWTDANIPHQPTEDLVAPLSP